MALRQMAARRRLSASGAGARLILGVIDKHQLKNRFILLHASNQRAFCAKSRSALQDEVAGLRIASLAPGVVDTDMQSEIRAVDPTRFPLRDRFRAMKEEGALTAPHNVAARIVDYLLSADFAADPTPDVRRL